MSEPRNNHYVPQWYQKRFVLPGQKELYYRNLKPAEFRDGRGRVVGHEQEVRRRPPSQCFVERDLYTNFLGATPLTEIEKSFFGGLDALGKRAIEVFSDYTVKEALGVYGDLLNYLGAQKLRTPKGLAWIASQAETAERTMLLELMQRNHRMYHAVWSECVWQVADASQSSTKFIISDHPVTLYNRHCGPRHDLCRGCNDPDLVLAATQTVFPLGLEKVLLLTNLTWARNPYQDPLARRPNPRLNRTGVFKALGVQTDRILTEQEVREINFIVRSRAYQYLAGADEDWLYPERYISKSDWAKFGEGYLLFPDPRYLHMGGSVFMQYESGRRHAADEYGRQPFDPEFEHRGMTIDEGITLNRFKGEFARLFGPIRRGRVHDPTEAGGRDSDELHEYHLSLEEEGRRQMRGYRLR